MYNTLNEIKLQLHDAPTEVKEAFNTVVRYFDNEIGIYVESGNKLYSATPKKFKTSKEAADYLEESINKLRSKNDSVSRNKINLLRTAKIGTKRDIIKRRARFANQEWFKANGWTKEKAPDYQDWTYYWKSPDGTLRVPVKDLNGGLFIGEVVEI